jgi:hypothetical protein
MKRPVTGLVALLAGAFVIHSQGVAWFGNYSYGQPYTFVSLGTTKLGGSSTVTTGNPFEDVANGNDWTVALYGNGTGINPLVQLYTSDGEPVTATLEDGNPDQTPGTWFVWGSSAFGAVPNTTLPGQSATLQVYAWYNAGGTITSYAAAVAAGVPVGVSATVDEVTGGKTESGPPSFPGGYPGFGNITLQFSYGGFYPEPSMNAPLPTFAILHSFGTGTEAGLSGLFIPFSARNCTILLDGNVYLIDEPRV